MSGATVEGDRGETPEDVVPGRRFRAAALAVLRTAGICSTLESSGLEIVDVR